MICRKCNANIADNAKFCPTCGAKVELAETKGIQTKRCPSCGTENPVAAKFCKTDGYNLQEVQPAKGESSAEVEKPKDVIFCPQCKTPYPITARFCKNDGTFLKEEISPPIDRLEVSKHIQTKRKVGEVAPRKLSKIKIVLTFLGLVLILAGTGGYLYLSGFFKDPLEIQEKINTELKGKELNNISITINKNWVATVSGVVNDLSHKDQALNIVRSYKEVKEVIDSIQVRLPSEIEKDINYALKDGGIKEIYAEVGENLVTTLKGIAENEEAKAKAINIVRAYNNDFKVLKDEIQIKPSPDTTSESIPGRGNQHVPLAPPGGPAAPPEKTPAAPQQSFPSPLPKPIKIDSAKLEGEINKKLRNVGLMGVTAEVSDDLYVTLKGSVMSDTEARMAHKIAKDFEGVKGVNNKIFIISYR